MIKHVFGFQQKSPETTDASKIKNGTVFTGRVNADMMLSSSYNGLYLKIHTGRGDVIVPLRDSIYNGQNGPVVYEVDDSLIVYNFLPVDIKIEVVN